MTDKTEAQIAQRLVQQIQQGDKSAETDMVERYQRGLLFMLRHRSKNPDLAKDIAQDTWKIVIEKVRNKAINQPEKLAAFIVQIGKNQLKMSYRGASNKYTTVDIDDASAPDPQPKPQQILESNNTTLIVRKLIAELTVPRDQEIMMRVYVKEQDKQEVCEALALDDLHFNRVLFRARQRFKELWVHYFGADP